MPSIKEMENQVESLTSFFDLIESYEEIAAIRMRNVKKSVLTSRDYLSGLNDVYSYVRSSYLNYVSRIRKKEDIDAVQIKTNGKTVHVLLSANTGLYGDVLGKSFKLFFTDSQRADADLVIVGKRGRYLMDSSTPKLKYEYFDFSDSGEDEDNFTKLMNHTIKYKNIIVYHTMFKDILSQEPTKTPVTGEDVSDFFKRSGMARGVSQEGVQAGIFEPSITDIVSFFGAQVLSHLFEQSIHESNLSKYASRMVNLDSAIGNISDQIHSTKFKLTKAKHRRMNNKQLSLISSISLWN